MGPKGEVLASYEDNIGQSKLGMLSPSARIHSIGI